MYVSVKCCEEKHAYDIAYAILDKPIKSLWN